MKMKNLDNIFKRISDMTAENRHTEAILEGCRMVGDENLINQAEYLVREHMRIGYVDPLIQSAREKVAAEMDKKAKAMFMSSPYFKLFKNCF